AARHRQKASERTQEPPAQTFGHVALERLGAEVPLVRLRKKQDAPKHGSVRGAGIERERLIDSARGHAAQKRIAGAEVDRVKSWLLFEHGARAESLLRTLLYNL